MSPRAAKPKPPPPVFVIDTREQTPFPIWQMTDWNGQEIGKDRIVRSGLKTGDYSIVGYESICAVERKSFDDFFGSITFGRDRLLDEIERAREMKFFAFVIEAPLHRISAGHPRHRKFKGSDAVRTVLSWQIRYPWVHWWLCDNRIEAALATVRITERFAMVYPELAAPKTDQQSNPDEPKQHTPESEAVCHE